jgi:TonB family protein
MRRILAFSVLIAPLFISAAALASQPVTDASASTTTRPLSTGVTPARVVYSTNVALTPAAVETLPYDAEVVVKLNVDENGKAQDIQVVKSPSHYLDSPVATAVRQFKFQPATLDNQPVAADLTLTVVLAH